MKVQFAKFQNQNPSFKSSEDLNTDDQAASQDLFYDLMTATLSQPMMSAEAEVSEVLPETEQAAVAADTNPIPPAIIDFNPLILSTAALIPQPVETKQDGELSLEEQVTAKQTATNIAATDDAITLNTAPIALSMNNMPSKKEDINLPLDDKNDEQVEKIDFKSIKNINHKEAVETEKVNLGLDPLVAKQASQVQSSESIVDLSAAVLDKKEETKDKYTQALSQLGNIINSHTSKLIDIDKTKSQAILPQAETNLPDKMATDYQLKIDLLPGDIHGLKNSYMANIKIYPPELGNVLAKLKVDKSSAELTILAENSHVKAIIESNINQLRENFQSADINLLKIDVQSSQTGTDNQQGQQEQAQQQAKTFFSRVESSSLSGEDVESAPRRLNSLVDTYV